MDLRLDQVSSLGAVKALRTELGRVRLPFPSNAAREANQASHALVELLDNRVIPQLEALGIPEVVALVGPTGSGKSVLANTLAGGELSAVGAVRPTTQVPQVLAHPVTIKLLGAHPALDAGELIIDDTVPVGRLLVDFADPFATGNNAEAAQPDLPADAWLVVVSALRYGDAVVWDLIAMLMGAQSPVALVVNRIHPNAVEAITTDCRERLAARGWPEVPVLVTLAAKTAAERLPRRAISEVTGWLEQVGSKRAVVLEEGLPPLGAYLAELVDKTAVVLDGQAQHQAAVALLRQASDHCQAGIVAKAAGSLTRALEWDSDDAGAGQGGEPSVGMPLAGESAPLPSVQPVKTAQSDSDDASPGQGDAITDAPASAEDKTPPPAGQPELPDGEPAKPGGDADLTDAPASTEDKTPLPTGQPENDEATAVQQAWERLAAAFGPWLEAAEPGEKTDPKAAQQAIEQLGAVVAEWDGRAVEAVAQQALQEMAKLWAGAGVPQGTRQLVQDYGLTPAAMAKLADRAAALDSAHLLSQGSALDVAHVRHQRAWTNRLMEHLTDELTADVDQLEPPLARTELATLIQAAAMGAAGPFELLGKVVPNQAEALTGLGWRTRVDAHRAAIFATLRPFEAALEQITVPDRPALTQLIGWLNQAAARERVAI